MEEQKKEKKARGPRKTALQQLEADRDRYKKQRDEAFKKLNVARAAITGLQAAYDAADAADAAFNAMDGAVKAQKEGAVTPAVASR